METGFRTSYLLTRFGRKRYFGNGKKEVLERKESRSRPISLVSGKASGTGVIWGPDRP
jgi:hypothetical protein